MNLNRFYEYWNALEQREQYALTIGGICLFLGCLYWSIWFPIESKLTQVEAKVQQQTQTLAWLQQSLKEVSQLRTNLDGSDLSQSTSLESVLNKSAREQGISLTRIRKQGNQLQLTCEPTEFNRLLNWMQLLDQRYGIKIKTLNIDKMPEQSGFVLIKQLQVGRDS